MKFSYFSLFVRKNFPIFFEFRKKREKIFQFSSNFGKNLKKEKKEKNFEKEKKDENNTTFSHKKKDIQRNNYQLIFN